MATDYAEDAEAQQHINDQVAASQKALYEAVHELMDQDHVQPLIVAVAAADLIGTLIAIDMLSAPNDLQMTLAEHLEGVAHAVSDAVNNTLAHARNGN